MPAELGADLFSMHSGTSESMTREESRSTNDVTQPGRNTTSLDTGSNFHQISTDDENGQEDRQTVQPQKLAGPGRGHDRKDSVSSARALGRRKTAKNMWKHAHCHSDENHREELIHD